ncbi:hypothetical protein ZWY2020_058359 [Hordeum vulgare]|nr:hypothetical protein ZWY2020_058359 [Hordeum vulgare]
MEQKSKEQAAELSKISSELKSERVERRFLEEEMRQAKKIADGKPYLLQCVFGGNRFAFLTRLWHSPCAFMDLPRSAADTTKHHAAQDGDVERRLFGAQFRTPEPNPLLVYQMKQLMELHRMAEPAMKDLCIRLWPSEPLPSSYFILVRKLYDVVPQLEVLKYSICIEGAHMAFARTMMHWPGVKPLTIATASPPPGKEHRRLELYLCAMTEGALVIEAYCSKDVIYE